MPSAFASRFRRPLAGLLCAPLMLTACGATEPLASAGAARWPTPAPDRHMQAMQAMQAAQAAQAVPNFEAPSATHCARPPQTHETPGLQRGAQFERRDLRERRALADEAAPPDALRKSSRAEAGGAVAAPVAPVAPAPAAVMAMPSPAAPPAPSAAAAKPATTAAAPRLTVRPPAQAPRPANEPVTAGMVDDNADFGAYMAFRARTQVPHRERDIGARHLLQVRDARGAVVPDAEVAVQAPGGAAMWARTDAGGRAWLHPDAFDAARSEVYEVSVRQNGRQGTAFLRRGQKNAVEVVLDGRGATAAQRAQLDLVFLIDATGSMDDEIARLKGTLRTIADQVARLPSRPDTCFGLVAYRDRSDDFLVRRHDFTNDLNAFQGVLDRLQAAGGGDYPEAMNEALNETVHRLSWRGNGTTRLVVLLADAPPHLDYGGPQYDDDMVAALGKGIKVFSVGASGLDKQGEYIQRQIAQYTGGRFVFLTYKDAANPSAGAGTQTVHDVGNYSVQTLDQLIVRLVSEELGKLPAGG